MYLHQTPRLVRRIFPQYLWALPGRGKKICLTFDDGPVPGVTDYVLSTLARYNVPATFFCVGDNIRKYPEVFRKVLNDGHQVGNHTFSHLNGWNTETQVYLDNVQRCNELMDMHTAGNGGRAEERFFRPPYGRLSKAQSVKLRKSHRIVMWDLLVGDFDRSLHPRKCLQKSLKAVRPGTIVLFHDSLKSERTMRYVLPRFIEAVKDKGYTFTQLHA